jgi:hypothetical protein
MKMIRSAVLCAITGCLFAVGLALCLPTHVGAWGWASLRGGYSVPTTNRMAALPTTFMMGTQAQLIGSLPGDSCLWAIDAGIPTDICYAYLEPGWAGSYVSAIMAESQGATKTPHFTYAESQSASDSYFNNSTDMAAYYPNFRTLLEDIQTYATAHPPPTGTATAIIDLEPDSFGYLQNYCNCTTASSVPASVASSGFTDTNIPSFGSLPNTVAGLLQAYVLLRNAYAPNVILAYHVMPWTGGSGGTADNYDAVTKPQAATAAGTHIAQFLNSAFSGTGLGIDSFVVDVSDADSAYNSAVCGDASNIRLWWGISNNGEVGTAGVNNFTALATFVSAFSYTSGLKGWAWQVPVGNTVMKAMDNDGNTNASGVCAATPGTCRGGHYQDDRVQYWVQSGNPNLSQLISAGLLGLEFSSPGQYPGLGQCGGTNNLYGSTAITNFTGNNTGSPYNPAPIGISDSNANGTFPGNTTNNGTATVNDDDGGFLRQQLTGYYGGGAWGARPGVSPSSPPLQSYAGIQSYTPILQFDYTVQTPTFTNGSANIGLGTVAEPVGSPIFFTYKTGGGSLPSNIPAYQIYYVISSIGTTIQVSLTPGGAAVVASGVGSGTQYASDPAINIAAAIVRYQTIGATWLRTLASPVEMGCSPSGTDSFGLLDYLLGKLNTAGIRLLLDIGQTVASGNCGSFNGGAGWLYPASYSLWTADFVTPVVAHYAALGVHNFEIWNEPNGCDWNGTCSISPNLATQAAAFETMMEDSYAAAHAADPLAFVLASLSTSSGDPSYAPCFLQAMFNAKAATNMDALAAHPYPNNGNYPTQGAGVTLTGTGSGWLLMFSTLTTNPQCPSTPNLLGVLEANGFPSTTRIWVTEIGCGNDGQSGNQSYFYCSQTQQATLMSAVFSQTANEANLGVIFPYEDHDVVGNPCNNPTDTYTNECAGLFNGSYVAKPAATAYQNATKNW